MREQPWPLVCFEEELFLPQRKELERLVQSFKDVFREEPGHARGVERVIKTPMGTLVRESWRPIPQHLHQEIQAELRRMIEQKIIHQSRSLWCSPIVPVAKPNGSLCLCVDFQKLNALTTFDAFPMPHIAHEYRYRMNTGMYKNN